MHTFSPNLTPSAGYITVVFKFFDVTHQAIELPLALNLRFVSQAKTIQSFISANVGEHGFYH